MRDRPFSWNKLGFVFRADGRYPWMQDYAQVPTPVLHGETIRVFFTCRPPREASGDYVSHTTFLDVDRRDPTRVVHVHDRPCMELGALGTFDQHGVMPCSVVRRGTELWMYYVGWSRTRGVPWHAAIGLATSVDDGATFVRIGQGPLVERRVEEPFVHGSPTVLEHEGRWHMWYLAGTRWVDTDAGAESIYSLRHAVSADGLRWERESRPCVPVKHQNECQARPAVLQREGRWNMWFSCREGTDFRTPERGYRIGYAHSADMLHWQRDDAIGGLERSGAGWDSEMVSYPSIIEVDGRVLMFYCGNQMGYAGFGVAELDAGPRP